MELRGLLWSVLLFFFLSRTGWFGLGLLVGFGGRVETGPAGAAAGLLRAPQRVFLCGVILSFRFFSRVSGFVAFFAPSLSLFVSLSGSVQFDSLFFYLAFTSRGGRWVPESDWSSPLFLLSLLPFRLAVLCMHTPTVYLSDPSALRIKRVESLVGCSG